jgi:tRNA-splicing endonuclease subunit Sen34
MSLEAKEIKEKQESAGRAMSEKAILRRQEREAKRAAAAQLRSVVEDDSVHTPSQPLEPEHRSSTPVESPPTSPPYTITITGSSTTFSWYTSEPNTYETIEAAQSVGIWNYPSTLEERAKCAVFQDLWEKGYYMGGGIKFGGDFLVYPGAYSCCLFLIRSMTLDR